jgi:phage-related protein (TIGR01555 family)
MTLPLLDGFTNLVSNLGAANGKTGANGYLTRLSGQQEVETAYESSTWFGKILDIRADDATREGRSWKGDKDQIEKLEAEELRLGFWPKVNQAIKWADLYGGAVIIPDLPGNSASPLRPESVTAGSVKFLSVLNRYDIQAEGIDRNPLSPGYGGPERYRVNTQVGLSLVFHPSRVVLFNGRTTGSLTNRSEVWGTSLWTHLADSILASDSAAAVISALMQEAKIDVIGSKGLMDGLGNEAGYDDLVMQRWQLVAMLKSVANVTLIDADDTWEQKSINWAGLPEAVQTLLTVMAGAADIPLTRLTGVQAKGLSNGGDVDLRNYYDGVKAKQKLQISPMLAPLDEIMIRNALGDRPDDLWYDWRPLWQPSEKERAETQKIRAETFQIELNTGALDEEPLAKSYINGAIESGLYPGYEQAIADAPGDDDGIATEEEQAEEITRQEALAAPEREQVAVGDAAPRTLYVRRDVVNKAEITKWAKAQGFTDIVPDLHVTITYSRAPVDWFKMGSTWDEEMTLPKGGARQMETFGEAKVLLIQSNSLHWRHEEMVANGASHDFPEYQPHITISYGAMPEGVEPYRGKIVLGPEIFEEVKG